MLSDCVFELLQYVLSNIIICLEMVGNICQRIDDCVMSLIALRGGERSGKSAFLRNAFRHENRAVLYHSCKDEIDEIDWMDEQSSSITTETTTTATTVIDRNVTDLYRVTIEACFSHWHRVKKEGSDSAIEAGQVLTQQFFYLLSQLNERVNFDCNEKAKNSLTPSLPTRYQG